MRGVVTFCLGLVAGMAAAEDIPLELSNPAARYTRQNPEVKTLSYWGGEITLGIIGKSAEGSAFYATSLLKILSESAGVKMRVSDGIRNQPSSSTSLNANSNFLIVFDNIGGDTLGKKSSVSFDDLPFEAADVLPEIGEKLNSGIPRRGVGCFGDWVATDGNEIIAFVQVIDTNASRAHQRECIDFMTPASFGIYPGTTTLDFPSQTADGQVERFVDRSEVFLLLRVSAFCRNQLRDNTFSCPVKILRSLYEVHSDFF